MRVEVAGISKAFFERCARTDVLRDCSLVVEPGELVALSGANGAGKTTLLKILATLVAPDAGDARMNGISVRFGDTVQLRQMIGLVTDTDRSFYQMLSIEENLRFYGRLFGISGREVARRLSELEPVVELSPWLSMRSSHCSSGIRQKAAFARALLTQPSVLLIDELSRSLDEPSRERISTFLRREVTARNRTCLAVTHDAAWAAQYADRHCVLRAGRIEPL